MKSWKTTLSGAVTALGVYLSGVTEPAWLSHVGEVLIIVGSFLTGAFARDNSKSSETVGAK